MLIMKSWKGEITEGAELPNQVKIRTLEEKGNFTNTWEYLKRTPSNKRRWKKKKMRKESHRRVRKLLETKLSQKNLTKGEKTFGQSFFLDIARNEQEKNSAKWTKGQEIWKRRTRSYIRKKT